MKTGCESDVRIELMICLPGVFDFLSVSTCLAYSSSVSTLKQLASARKQKHNQFDQLNIYVLDIYYIIYQTFHSPKKKAN